MKLRNFLIFAMAILMAITFVSCKPEPEPQPEPQPQPTPETVYKVTVTEGVSKDYYNRDKLKLFWEEEVKPGDTITLKYRSERDVFQWDIRGNNASIKYVYEFPHNAADGFEAPVLGDDGWYTLSYTFGTKNYKGVDVNEESIDDFVVNFRGNWVAGDVFEVKSIKLNEKALEITEENIQSKGTVETTTEHEWTIADNNVVLFATGTLGESDKTPYAEKVAVGGKISGATLPAAEAGYELKLYSDSAKTVEFDVNTIINADTTVYYEYKSTTPPPALAGIITVSAAEAATFSQADKFQFRIAEAFVAEDSISFKVKVNTEKITIITVRAAGASTTKFLTDAKFSEMSPDGDGFYTISNVSATLADNYLGFSFATATGEQANVGEIIIKDLKINDVAVDLTGKVVADYVKDFSGVPSPLTATIE